MAVKVPLQVMGLSVTYAAALGWLERKYPSIKPDHIWAEVAGGVLVTLVPVTLAAHSTDDEEEPEALHWQTYEGTVWRAFFSSAIPIILWQLGESLVRHNEFLSYKSGHGASAQVLLADLQGLEDGEATDVQDQENAAAIIGELIRYLHAARNSTDHACARVHGNPGLALQLVSEANQATASALACLGRIREWVTATASSAAAS
jgi:hypothetical protein